MSYHPSKNPDHEIIDISGKSEFTAENISNLRVKKGSKTIRQLIKEELDGNLDLTITDRNTLKTRYGV